LVQREIGDHALQAAILVPELAQLPELAHAQVAKLPLPAVERGLGDLELPADVRHRRPRFDLPQGEGDLLHTEPTRPHRTVPSRLRPGVIGPARNLPLSVSPRWSYYQGAPPARPGAPRELATRRLLKPTSCTRATLPGPTR